MTGVQTCALPIFQEFSVSAISLPTQSAHHPTNLTAVSQSGPSASNGACPASMLAFGRIGTLAFAVSGSVCLVARGKIVAVCRTSSSSEVMTGSSDERTAYDSDDSY